MADLRFDIKVDDHGAIQQLERFPGLKEQAMTRALNRTADWVKNRTLDAITANLAIKRSDLDDKHRFGGVVVKKAGYYPFAQVSITGGRIPLFRFSGKPSEPKQPPPRSGISFRIDAGGGRKRVKSNAFVARMASGHIGFFRRVIEDAHRIKIIAKSGARKGKWITSQHHIAELHGPSIPHVAERRPEFKKMLAIDAGARLEEQVGREVSFILTGTSKLSNIGGA